MSLTFLHFLKIKIKEPMLLAQACDYLSLKLSNTWIGPNMDDSWLDVALNNVYCFLERLVWVYLQIVRFSFQIGHKINRFIIELLYFLS